MKVTIDLVGPCHTKKWKNHFLYSVTVNGEVFEFRTGSGWAVPYHDEKTGKKNKKPENSKALPDLFLWVKLPTINDVMESLFLDSEAAASSFYDFCDDCGYSKDSIKALDIYKACLTTREQLKRALKGEYSVELEKLNEELNK